MTYWYSPSTGGFYLREIHGDLIPSDAVPVSEAEHAALFSGESGCVIHPDADGFPRVVPEE